MSIRNAFLITAIALLVAFNIAAEEPQALVGSVAPDFSLLDTEGAEVHLADYFGKVIVLGFFDSQHGYCSTILPQLQSLKQDFEGVVVLGVDSRAEPAVDLEETMTIFSITFPLLLQGEPVAVVYDMMETGAVLIDREGIIRARDVASIKEAFFALLADLLNE